MCANISLFFCALQLGNTFIVILFPYLCSDGSISSKKAVLEYQNGAFALHLQ